MTREIKFRVWDNVDYMSSPFNFTDILNRTIEFTEDCVVVQFTGLKDKNGREIYEGDILQFIGGQKTAGVYWNEAMASFCITDGKGLPLGSWTMPHSEVIGNIYENPDLLKS